MTTKIRKVKSCWCPGICNYPDGDPVTAQEFESGVYPSEPGDEDWETLCQECKTAIKRDIKSRSY